ncbi:hypothetical protein Ancab_008497 [Ancistrocladus abbreviatus]
MAEGNKKLKIVLFPWLAFGHIIPFFHFSEYLAQKEPTIDAEATVDIPFDRLPSLAKASDGLLEPMEEFLRTTSPDWILYDLSCHWLPPIAVKLGIKQVLFSVINASNFCFIFGPSDATSSRSSVDSIWMKPEDLTVPPKWMTFPTNVAFRLHEAKRIFLAEASACVPASFRLASVLQGCDVIALRTCIELEASYIKLFQEFQAKPVFPLGLMPYTVNDNEDDDGDNNSTWQEIRRSMDQYDQASVVYVAFGTEATQSQEDITEVALGLELSKLPFFWALKERVGLSAPALPDGIEERTKDRGLVFTGWAPQVKILSHRSIGGFLTHCGWNSVVEGFQFGRPLIMLPFLGDQCLNARLMGEKKVGVEVPRDEENGTFSKNSIAETITSVVVDERGEIHR